MFTEKNSLFLKKDKIYDFVNNSYHFGFMPDDGDSYICKKALSDTNDELYIQFTVDISSLHIYIELNVPCAYWIELGLENFEPLWEPYQQGYIETK